MSKPLIQICVILLLSSINSSARTTVKDCSEHDSRCQAHCYEIYNNVKNKSNITEQYLKKCTDICIRRKDSCIERAREIEQTQRPQNDIDASSAIDKISQSTENYPRTPNEIYKYRDDKGQLHVVDDINKIPRKYRTDINE